MSIVNSPKSKAKKWNKANNQLLIKICEQQKKYGKGKNFYSRVSQILKSYQMTYNRQQIRNIYTNFPKQNGTFKWTHELQILLFKLRKQGKIFVQIAKIQQFKSRTESQLRNKFYSNIRSFVKNCFKIAKEDIKIQHFILRMIVDLKLIQKAEWIKAQEKQQIQQAFSSNFEIFKKFKKGKILQCQSDILLIVGKIKQLQRISQLHGKTKLDSKEKTCQLMCSSKNTCEPIRKQYLQLCDQSSQFNLKSFQQQFKCLEQDETRKNMNQN